MYLSLSFLYLIFRNPGICVYDTQEALREDLSLKVKVNLQISTGYRMIMWLHRINLWFPFPQSRWDSDYMLLSTRPFMSTLGLACDHQ